jgi:serine/threonine protein kinase
MNKTENPIKIELLNQGTYGCVYHPGLDCNEKPQDKKYVTKIHSASEKTTMNEIAVSKKIRENIKDYELYFAPVLENCNVNLAEVEREDVEKCEFIESDIKEFQNTNREFSGPMVRGDPFSGKPFSKKDLTGKPLPKDPPLIYMSTKIKYIKGKSLYKHINKLSTKISKDKLYSEISFLYKTLCLNIDKLTQIKVVHYDLKENNIIVSKKGIPVVIDFGISIDMEKLDRNNLKNAFYVYSTDYDPWCIEIVLINYIVHEQTPEMRTNTIQIMKIFDEVMAHNKFENEEYLKDALSEYRIHFKKQIADKYNGKKNKELLDYLLTTYDRWDIYAMTIMFIEMLSRTNIKPNATHEALIKKNLGFTK